MFDMQSLYDEQENKMSTERIYVVDNSGMYAGGDVYFWAIDVQEMPKSYKVLQAYDYMGDGNGKSTDSPYLNRSYNKTDKRVFLDFDKARNFAVEMIKEFIKVKEEQLSEDQKKLEMWTK